MKVILTILLLALSILKSVGQDHKKELDFIIVVDDNIAIGSVSQLTIKVESSGNERALLANYHPGNLSLEQADYDRLLSEDIKRIFLDFNYYEYIKGEQQIYHYQIELKKPWLKDYFNVLRIYNVNKKQYSKVFTDKEGKGYVYELDSPSHTFHLIRNK